MAKADPDRLRLRATFDKVAERYDRIRPGYPVAVFDDLATLTGAGPGARLLEIGCGTGQATRSLAERGYQVLAIELGANLAALARRRFAGSPTVRVVNADFDRWTSNGESFDVVFAATAFHWLDPVTRFDRSAGLLRPGGALATITTYHINGGTERFFVDVQRCYHRYERSAPASLRMPTAADIPFDEDLGEHTRFGAPVFRRYEWDASYRTAEYLDLIGTYSPTLALSDRSRRGLLRCVGSLIDDRYGGVVVKRYLTELRVARLGPDNGAGRGP